MLGIPTFLSHFFICNPILFLMELEQLEKLGLTPRVYAHPDCMVTTFVDMMINQIKENKRGGRRHGSCGVGFHETIARSRVPELIIRMGDLWNGGRRLESQLEEICTNYAKFRVGQTFNEDHLKEAFIKSCIQLAEYIHPLGIGQCEDPVFEASQGLLLDMDNKEFFPHVTHSHTGMKNVNALCAQAGITEKEIYYVSRTYLTRHGAGPLPGEDSTMSYEDDTNAPNDFQGSLRFAPLDTNELLKRCMADADGLPHKLVLSHCDQKAPDIKANLYSHGPTRNDISAHALRMLTPVAS